MKTLCFILLFFLPFLSNCGNNQVQKDLNHYLHSEIPKVTFLENKAVSSYESVTGPNYTNDQNLYRTLNEQVIPVYKEFISKLKGADIKTDEVRSIHSTYIKTAKLQLKAFNKMVEAIRDQNELLVPEINSMIEKARKLMQVYQQELENLARKFHLQIENAPIERTV